MHTYTYVRTYVHTHFPLQVLPVVFAVRATLTPSALEFSVKEVDFGCVGLQESVLSSVEVTNTSSLVQEIGFVNTPNVRVVCVRVCVYVQCMHHPITR